MSKKQKNVSLKRNFRDALRASGPRPVDGAAKKKNYAETFSRHLATLFADRLRKKFPKITPDESGGQQEKRAKTGKGSKKLDVNYSTPELGLALGVSIKTVNFRDGASKRYTKNFTRADNEFRAESLDYHVRQPWAVLVGVVFVPVDSCDDCKSKRTSSSFGQAVKVFRHRANRVRTSDPGELFEQLFIGLYALDDEDPWDVRFFDVMQAPPRAGRPTESSTFTFDGVIAEIIRTYNARNDPPVEWAPE